MRSGSAIVVCLLACHCATPRQMVRVVGTQEVVPLGDASERLERAALERRAAHDMQCMDLTLERTRELTPIARVRGCGKERLYLRAIRGWLPDSRLPGGPVEVGVADFVDVARAKADDPFAGLGTLPGEVPPYDRMFEYDWTHLTGADLVSRYVKLNEVAAAHLGCPRDGVVPWADRWHLHRNLVSGCGSVISYLWGGEPPAFFRPRPEDRPPWPRDFVPWTTDVQTR
jgi:hypothetical protein